MDPEAIALDTELKRLEALLPKTIEKEKENLSDMAVNFDQMTYCNECGLLCISEKSLKSHMMLSHEGKKKKFHDRELSCEMY